MAVAEYQTDLLTTSAEDLKPLAYARKWWIPRRENNHPISPATIHRWSRKGVHSVKLAGAVHA
ncbi:MAG: hypothetical protein R3C59_17725 [Planctomycetaceae bacterium]